jgi:hypothetical protein
MGEVTVTIGFDAASRRVTIDGEPTGEPIAIGIGREVAEGFDYQAEAYKTCSPHWNPQHIEYDVQAHASAVRRSVRIAEHSIQDAASR